jgi:hypothetical protein
MIGGTWYSSEMGVRIPATIDLWRAKKEGRQFNKEERREAHTHRQ